MIARLLELAGWALVAVITVVVGLAPFVFGALALLSLLVP